jgi:hypothetical protein
MVMEVMVDPVLFVKRAPIVGFKLPDKSPPNALSVAEVLPKL